MRNTSNTKFIKQPSDIHSEDISRPFELSGSVVPLVSPLLANEDIDTAAVKRLVKFHKVNGTDAIFVLGTCGEGACLKDSAKIQMVEASLDAAEDIPIVVGVAETSTQRAIHWVELVTTKRPTALVVLPPLFQFASSVDEHVRHVQEIFKATELPLILYNLPKKTGGHAIPMEAVRILLEKEIVVGIKDSSGDIDYFRSLISLRKEFPSFRIMNGELTCAAIAMTFGADGLVMSYTNVDPVGCSQIIAASKTDDAEKVQSLQAEFLEVWGSLSDAVPAAKAKSILTAMGLCAPICCKPVKDLKPYLPNILRKKYG